MYVGRFIVVAPDRAAYRVSSRSFPNRKVIERDGSLTVVPTAEAPETDNPYISYNCLRTTEAGEHAVIGNGTQVDPITEKLELGYPARDALAESLLALDYEKDDYDTPGSPASSAKRATSGSSAGTRCSSRRSKNRPSSPPTKRTHPRQRRWKRQPPTRWPESSTSGTSNIRSVRPPSPDRTVGSERERTTEPEREPTSSPGRATRIRRGFLLRRGI